VRITPPLNIKVPNLVKGIHLQGLRVLGKPERFARHYYEQGDHELLYMDVAASFYQRKSWLDLVSRPARKSYVPLGTKADGPRLESSDYLFCRHPHWE
jgi:cyclase